MFTGLIETTGVIESLSKASGVYIMTIGAPALVGELVYGQSVAVSGVCLTVTSLTSSAFSVDVTEETMNRTRFSSLRKGHIVNLERAMKLSDRLDGHIVSGHVDDIAVVESIKKSGDSMEVYFKFPRKLAPYIVEKGSIAIDGISLTVAAVTEDLFSVAFIPVTIKDTTMKNVEKGNIVNIEVDIIGRYVEKMLSPFKGDSSKSNDSLTFKKLSELGW